MKLVVSRISVLIENPLQLFPASCPLADRRGALAVLVLEVGAAGASPATGPQLIEEEEIVPPALPVFGVELH
jgi:hypothetical protein